MNNDDNTKASFLSQVSRTLNFHFADYVIDAARYELRRAGKLIAIEPQVFDMLVYLIQNRNRVVSKDELIDAIWQGRIVSDASLSSCVGSARRAIGDNGFDQMQIRTYHKRGFRFVGRFNNVSPLADTMATQKPAVAVAQ
jgi:DNA-binding winged helix-turn-helix (wHTH) protein